MSELGDLIRDLRGKESLRDAAKRIGISHTYLDTIEKGYDRRSKNPVKPTPETLKLVSKAYGYPYEELMAKAGYIENETISKKSSGNFFFFDKEGLTDEEIELLEQSYKMMRERARKRAEAKKNKKKD